MVADIYVCEQRRRSLSTFVNPCPQLISPGRSLALIKIVLASEVHPDAAHGAAISIRPVPLLSQELPSTIDWASHEAVRSESCGPKRECLSAGVCVAINVEAFD